jgi:hypothetical protein
MNIEQYRYIPPTVTVEAVRIFPQELSTQDLDDLDAWLRPATAICWLSTHKGEKILHVEDDTSTHRVHAGEYLIVEPDSGEVAVYDEELFAKRYAKVEREL